MKYFSVLLALVLVTLALAACAEPLALDGTLAGVVCWPEGSAPEEASYVFRYSYPLLAGNNDAAVMINDHFDYEISNALAFTVPIDIDTSASSREVTGTVTCNDDRYFSVKIVTVFREADVATTTVTAATFSRTGSRAGIATSLPRLLGLLKDDETDEWLKDRQTNKANKLVWDLVWKQIRESGCPLRADLTQEDYQFLFYPEEDFYLDENGDPVFFVHAAYLAAEETDDVWLFPLSLSFLLDEL